MLGFNDLTLKAQAFVFSFLIGIFSMNAFAQQTVDVELPTGETISVDANQLEQAANDIDAESDKQDGAVKKQLKKISKGFKDFSQKLKKNKDRPKKKLTLKRVLMGAGKATTFVSVQTARPFVNAAGFIKGFFEKPSKNEDKMKYMKFFLKYEDKFSDIWKDFDPRLEEEQKEKIVESFKKRANSIVEEKRAIINEDMMAYFSENTELLSNEAVMEFVNNHPEFADVKELVGPIDSECIECLDDLELFADPFAVLNADKITAIEGVAGYAVKTMVPKMVLGIVSKSLGSAVLGVGLVADAGFVTSALMCSMNKKMKSKIDDGDDELAQFCRYVVNKSAYQISKSRMKGYVKGKDFRRKFIKKSEKVKRKFQKKKGEEIIEEVDNKA